MTGILSSGDGWVKNTPLVMEAYVIGISPLLNQDVNPGFSSRWCDVRGQAVRPELGELMPRKTSVCSTCSAKIQRGTESEGLRCISRCTVRRRKSRIRMARCSYDIYELCTPDLRDTLLSKSFVYYSDYALSDTDYIQ